MAEDRQIDAISIGVGVNLGKVRSDLQAVAGEIRSAKFPQRTVRVNIGSKILGDVQKDINSIYTQVQGLSKMEVSITPKLKPSQLTLRKFAAETYKAIEEGGGIKIPVKADLKTAKALKLDIEAAIGVINVPLTWSWKNGPPPAGTTSSGGGGGGKRARRARQEEDEDDRPQGGTLTKPRKPRPPTPPGGRVISGEPENVVTGAGSFGGLSQNIARTRPPRPAKPATPSYPTPTQATVDPAVYSNIAGTMVPGSPYATESGAKPGRLTAERRYFEATRANLPRDYALRFLAGGGRISPVDEHGRQRLEFTPGTGAETVFGQMKAAFEDADARKAKLLGRESAPQFVEHTPEQRAALFRSSSSGGALPPRFGKLSKILDRVGKTGQWSPEDLEELRSFARKGAYSGQKKALDTMGSDPTYALQLIRKQLQSGLTSLYMSDTRGFMSALGTRRASTTDAPDEYMVFAAGVQGLMDRMEKVGGEGGLVDMVRDQRSREVTARSRRLERAKAEAGGPPSPYADTEPKRVDAPLTAEEMALVRPRQKRVKVDEEKREATRLANQEKRQSALRANQRLTPDDLDRLGIGKLAKGGRVRGWGGNADWISKLSVADMVGDKARQERFYEIQYDQELGPVGKRSRQKELYSGPAPHFRDVPGTGGIDEFNKSFLSELYSPEREPMFPEHEHDPFGEDPWNMLGSGSRRWTPFDLRFPKSAHGGSVQGGLAARIAAAKAAKGKYIVGEERDELFVGKSGAMEILPHPAHVWSPPEDGKVEPFVPVWLRNLQAKDMTGKRAEGGPVYPEAFNFKRGGRSGFTSAEAIARAGVVSSGAIQRVFVVNWPGNLGGGAPVTGRAGGPLSARQMLQSPGLSEEIRAQIEGALGGGGGGRGGGRGTRTGASGDKPKGPKDIGLTESEGVAARFAAREATLADRQEIVLRRAIVAQQIQQSAARSVGPDVGQIVAAVGGRGAVQTRLRVQQLAESEVNFAAGIEESLVKKRVGLQIQLRRAQEAGEPELVEKYTDALEENQKSLAITSEKQDEYSARATALSKNVSTVSDRIKILGSNIVGIGLGTIGFSAALTAVQEGLKFGAQEGGKVVDIMSGFYLTSVKISDGLKEATLSANGNVKAVTNQAVAASGLSGTLADQTVTTLATRAAGEASNKHLEDQLDLVRTAARVGQQNQGFFAQNNVDRSTLLGTGGILPFTLPSGGQIGGNKSTLEVLSSAFTNATGGTSGQFVPPKLRGFLDANSPFVSAQDTAAGQADTTSLIRSLANTDIARGGSGSRFVAGSASDVAGTVAALTKLGQAVPEVADQARMFGAALTKSGTAIVDANGKVITSAGDLAKVFDSVQKGALKPTSQGLIESGEFQRRAQIGAINQQAQQQLGFSIPAAEFQDITANRPLPFGAGILPTGAGGFGGFKATGPGAGAFPGVRDMTDASLRALQGFAADGEKALQGIVPDDLLATFKDLSDKLYGLNLDAATQQANLSAVQYNHQLFLTKRNLADAAALAGKRSGIEGGLVGMLERETFELQKQSTALSLQMQQRQINFNLALAGFQAPGETSEERAARQKEAILEATYAQKQLNIAKKEFGVGIQLFDENSRRGLQEARFALADLTASRAVAIRVALDQQAAAAVGRHINAITSRMGVSINKQEALVAGAIAETAQIVAATGEAFADVLKLTAKAWGVFTQQGVDAVNAITGTNPNHPDTKDWNKYPHDGLTYGSGGVFNTMGASRITVGEAGGETVAILRNPRNVSGSAGGGVTILITGNTVRDQSDLEWLAVRVTRAVERSLNNKASLLNMRSVS